VPPRIVIDPGVLVSALISPAGAPARLLQAWDAGWFDLIVSERLLGELAGVLSREKFRRYVSLSRVDSYVVGLRTDGVFVDDPDDLPRLTPDPKDDYLVALARAADALLVSGDAHLIGLPGVMTPRDFLDALPSQA
jgi:putative PIN family toxin of toxin-antitoxin system